jgi:hypothetical protein
MEEYLPPPLASIIFPVFLANGYLLDFATSLARKLGVCPRIFVPRSSPICSEKRSTSTDPACEKGLNRELFSQIDPKIELFQNALQHQQNLILALPRTLITAEGMNGSGGPTANHANHLS